MIILIVKSGFLFYPRPLHIRFMWISHVIAIQFLSTYFLDSKQLFLSIYSDSVYTHFDFKCCSFKRLWTRYPQLT